MQHVPITGGQHEVLAAEPRAWRNRAVWEQEGVVTDQGLEQSVAETAQQMADRHRVQAALRTMSVEHRQLLLECYFRGASVADAAETLGVPSDTIKSRAHHALHAMRHAIDDMRDIA